MNCRRVLHNRRILHGLKKAHGRSVRGIAGVFRIHIVIDAGQQHQLMLAELLRAQISSGKIAIIHPFGLALTFFFLNRISRDHNRSLMYTSLYDLILHCHLRLESLLSVASVDYGEFRIYIRIMRQQLFGSVHSIKICAHRKRCFPKIKKQVFPKSSLLRQKLVDRVDPFALYSLLFFPFSLFLHTDLLTTLSFKLFSFCPDPCFALFVRLLKIPLTVFLFPQE